MVLRRQPGPVRARREPGTPFVRPSRAESDKFDVRLQRIRQRYLAALADADVEAKIGPFRDFLVAFDRLRVDRREALVDLEILNLDLDPALPPRKIREGLAEADRIRKETLAKRGELDRTEERNVGNTSRVNTSPTVDRRSSPGLS